MNYLILLGLSILGAILYRLGGAHGYNTNFRDVGMSIITILVLAFLCGRSIVNWLGMASLVLVLALTYGAQTTYFKRKGTEAKWWNWALVGLANGLALLPWALYSGQWIEWGIRTIGLVVLVMTWSEVISNAVWEECGRGFIIIASLGLFLRR